MSIEMKRILLILALSMPLTGCYGTIASMLLPSDDSGLEVNAQAGKQNNQEKTTGASFKEDVISGENVSVVKNLNGVPPWVWLIAILGWVLPSPFEIGRGIVKIFEYFLNKRWQQS